MTPPTTFDLTGLNADQFNMIQQGLLLIQRDAQILSLELQARAQAQLVAAQAPAAAPPAPASEPAAT
jgi:hypothetical protein